jgi:hypothetical protein
VNAASIAGGALMVAGSRMAGPQIAEEIRAAFERKTLT